jgi:hypothetical protein
MKRREFLKAMGSMALLPMLPRSVLANTTMSRLRPSDAVAVEGRVETAQ